MNKVIDIRQLKALILTHAKEIMREPGVLFWGIVFPLLMALGLGIAFTQSKDVIRTIAISDEGETLKNFLDKHSTERKGNKNEHELKIKDEKLGISTYIFKELNWKDAIVLLKRGEVNLIVTEKNKQIQYHFDPVNPEGELSYLNLSRIININNTQTTEQTIGVIDTLSQFSRDNVQPLALKGTRYIDFLVPGLIAMGVMMSSVWGLGYGLIEKRSKKLLRRMIATPMKKSHFLLSYMGIRTAMSFIEAALLFLFSWLVFGVTIQGSIAALVVIFLASNFAFAGIAILTASRTANTEIGNGLINAVTTPMIVLSGVFFSYHNFPIWAQTFIKLLPLTILADSIRSIFIEGAGFKETAFPFVVLMAIGVIFFLAGLKSFKWH